MAPTSMLLQEKAALRTHAGAPRGPLQPQRPQLGLEVFQWEA